MMTNDLARLVAEARKRQRLTQEELAEAIDKSIGYVGQLETGKVERPKPDTLRALSAVLGLTLDQLLVATGQLDKVDASVDPVRMLLLLDAMPTAPMRLAAYQQLPPDIRRAIRTLMRDLLLEEVERLSE